jgi:hypothetical protein
MSITFEDFIAYLQSLKSDDWRRMATTTWTIKDVVAHLLGWEAGDPEIIRQTWRTKESPWWDTTDDYDDFNKKLIQYYKDYTPEALISEWQTKHREVQDVITEIGESQLKSRMDLFGWLFDDSENSHISHHYRQIRKAVE